MATAADVSTITVSNVVNGRFHSVTVNTCERVETAIARLNYRINNMLDEIPNYDGDLRAPNFFVPLSETQVAPKLEIVLGAFALQLTRHWFDAEAIRALLRRRGVECSAVHTEAFHARKLMLVPAVEERWRA